MTQMTALMDLAGEDDAVPFARRFVRSEAFRLLFREGMSLVEQAAIYLDGDGREESRALPRLSALAYATESMRLTTRLMQIASWLLVQRAVAEGEITTDQARTEKHKVRLTPSDTVCAPDAFELLPEKLRDLVGQSLRLQERVRHLDALMTARAQEAPALVNNPVAGQLDLLRHAFAS